VKDFIRKLRAGESGQSIVELAVTLPLILTLLCGICEFGWVGSNVLTLQNITREGVRAGIVATDAADNTQKISDRIRDMAPSYLADGITFDIEYSDPVNFRAGDVSVTTYYNLKSITPLAGLFTQDGVFRLSAHCTMKMS